MLYIPVNCNCIIIILSSCFSSLSVYCNAFKPLSMNVTRGSQWGGGIYGYRLEFWLFYGYRLIFFSYG